MAVQKKIKKIALLVSLILSSALPVYAQTQQMTGTTVVNSTQQTSNPNSQRFLSRGEAVHQTVQTFDLRKKNADFINDCLNHLDECFFAFTAATRYYQVSLNPLKLYPDVSSVYAYADDINLATMLGLVHGNVDEKNSPFYPRAYMTRIQALKVVLGAAKMMDWREKFELVRDLGNEDSLRAQTTIFKDVDAQKDDTWWYPRYVNFALDSGVIDAGEYFRPDEPITAAEYQYLLQKTLKESVTNHAAKNSKTQPSGNSSRQAVY